MKNKLFCIECTICLICYIFAHKLFLIHFAREFYKQIGYVSTENRKCVGFLYARNIEAYLTM